MKKLFALMLGLSSLTSVHANSCTQESFNINNCGTTVVVADKHNMNKDMFANQIQLHKDKCGALQASVDLVPVRCQAALSTPVVVAEAAMMPTCCF